MSSDEEEVAPRHAAETTGAQTSPAEIIEATKAWSQVAKSFMYVEVSSLVLMFSCIGVWIEGYPELAYALSVSVISLAACLIIQTGEFFRPGLLERVEKPVSLFLFVWWAVGTGFITFKGPFIGVGNGFFSAWAGLIFTTHWALNIDTSKFTDLDKGRKIIAGLGTAGAVLLFACIPFIRSKFYLGQSAWGLSAGLITVIISAVLFKAFDDVHAQVAKIAAVFMFVVWATVAGVCTFDGPFLQAGNGYFASWGGFLLSTFFLQLIMTREDEIV
mmetsp:Transcript_52073/g.110668  ORF Transcript_52073/g.110668 Transcript_52073/m.110668 type:complete len:273 (+) Transcript_52073:99-917(+)|eukprot:CAMPEP_0172554392 /NCGR_PEP_ID=MMETSP1067-20121228/54339_1 /TAXON_ID=265564 ORGANISM="Thalassiosira punctigera, Strain Tpunct2005C2" /NCGR_SAMPLE_ID=MMETSP1067 /ASSEMBLY_ACC=CAM_ASM_000444 /LENGTH=272 /DNA_ID=CAMNT_0013342753 /DNA_START=95 /DNA_END=913 /DNA_ORIENTATION=+